MLRTRTGWERLAQILSATLTTRPCMQIVARIALDVVPTTVLLEASIINSELEGGCLHWSRGPLGRSKRTCAVRPRWPKLWQLRGFIRLCLGALLAFCAPLPRMHL